MSQEKTKIYRLCGGIEPLTFQLQSKDSKANSLTVLDEKGNRRSLAYCANQRSIYLDEHDQHAIWAPIIFTDGVLVFPSTEGVLAKFLDAHPGNVKNGGNKFFEVDLEAEAEQEMNRMDFEEDAIVLAREISFETMLSILFETIGETVKNMNQKQVQREVRVLARTDPHRFVELANSPKVEVRGLVLRAIEEEKLKLKELEDSVDVYKNYKEREGGLKMLVRVQRPKDVILGVEMFLMSNPGKNEYLILKEELDSI